MIGSGEWLGFKFYIVSVGSHPNAYIELNNDEIKKPWDCIIDVHGGITYQEESCHFPFKEMKGKPMIGWDYAHCEDFYISLRGPVAGKKWTSDEIVDECVSAIEQIIKEVNRAGKI